MKYATLNDLPATAKLPARLRLGVDALTRRNAAAVSQALGACAFVRGARANAAAGCVTILYDGGKREEVLAAVGALDAETLTGQEASDFGLDFRRRLYGKLLRHYAKRLLLPPWARIPLDLWNAARYVRRAIASLRQGKLGVETLDAAAVTASMAMGDWKAASSLMFLLGVSELLEGYTRERARNALADSLALNIDKVWVARDGVETLIPLADLRQGDKVVVRAGSVIPADGTVLSGEATVNQASLTGEATPVFKRRGDSVFAGTAVDEGEIAVEARSVADDSRVARIVKMIDESESLKAGIQGSAERVADKIVPLNFALAAGAYMLGGSRAALSALLVDYSCAIKISTPVAVLSAMREASARGLLVKGGKHLEAAAQADTVVFDKTGTLTAACPEVTHVGAFGGLGREDVLRMAACIEEHFPHSLARAVIRKAQSEGLLHAEEHAEVRYIAAHGIATSYEGRRAVIGSRHFVEDDEHVSITREQSEEIERNSGGGSVLYLASDGVLAGYLCITDPPRAEAREVIAALKALGVERVIMLTGDGESSARENASKLGIDEYRAQMLPEEKRAFVEGLKRAGRKTLMVGDGINDSPAMAAADVSVSMSDCAGLARETADVAMLNGDLWGLVALRLLGQRLLARIRGNYNAIIGVNSALLALGLLGAAPASVLSLAHNATTTAVSAASTRRLLDEGPTGK
ncbi:MAG: heavy metal translocating P-type ATPase [Clostridiales Family XIII bacterium]|jgi:heavy metal translocating P-type ATPase|nr:heavy metal translocating P-type ATPase [Clostridiales Family XIII bacterium]